MKKRTRALLLSIGLLFGMLSGGTLVSAQAPGGTLPATKTPQSARFDLSGSITSGSGGTMSTTLVKGSGAMSGSDAQFDLTVDAPKEAQSTGPTSLGMSFITVGDKLYFKFAGLDPSSDNQWYVTDNTASSTPAGAIPGMPGSTAMNPAFSDAYKITQVGKETLNGAPTTKYQVDVDMQKLAEESAAQSGSTAPTSQFAPGSKMTVLLWIGDNDQYLHKFDLTMNSTVTGQDTPPVTLGMELTMTLRDFDTVVKIVAPPNAVPLDLGAQGDTSSLFGGTGIPLGSAIGLPAGIMSSMPAGMPTTGSGSDAGMGLWLAFGGVCLLAGFGLRRRASTSV